MKLFKSLIEIKKNMDGSSKYFENTKEVLYKVSIGKYIWLEINYYSVFYGIFIVF